MNECISREAVYKFAKDLKMKETGAFGKGYNKGLRDVMSAVMNGDAIPTVDVVDVAETDKSRMNAICEHYEIDLSELLEWIEWKRKKPKTNADKIRSMSDEELAEWFYSGDFPWCVYEEDVVPCTYEDIPVHPCDRCLLNWLKQEAKDG